MSKLTQANGSGKKLPDQYTFLFQKYVESGGDADFEIFGNVCLSVMNDNITKEDDILFGLALIGAKQGLYEVSVAWLQYPLEPNQEQDHMEEVSLWLSENTFGKTSKEYLKIFQELYPIWNKVTE